MLHCIYISLGSFLIDFQLSVPRKASGGSSRRVRGSFHLSVFWWQRRVYLHARTSRVLFYLYNIQVPSEGRRNMRRLPFQAFLSHDVYSAAKSVLFHLTQPLDEKKIRMLACHKNKNVRTFPFSGALCHKNTNVRAFQFSGALYITSVS